MINLPIQTEPLRVVEKFDPSPGQADALTRIKEWHKLARSQWNTPVRMFKLGGYAGTGKTTLIRVIIGDRDYGTVVVCAFTGKAAHVLQKKGIPATTIHSLIYTPHEDPSTKEVTFKLKEQWDLANVDLIIIDEASMVSTELFQDLVTFRKPMLFVGDPGQLEPVGDNPNLMKQPDWTLTEIHRQALESPIIAFATAIREGGEAYQPSRFGGRPPGLVFQGKIITAQNFVDIDQLICARNKTRHTINQRARLLQGLKQYDGLHVGEKLICTQNNKEHGVFNGQVFFVESIKEETARWFEVVVRMDGTDQLRTVQVWSEPFYREIEDKERNPKELIRADFGYCITCHKSQGSEWKSVLVIDEWMPPRVWSMARWRYTAVTRASEKLVFAV